MVESSDAPKVREELDFRRVLKLFTSAAFPKNSVAPSVAVDYNSVKYAIRLDAKLVVNQACFPRFTCRVFELGRFPYKQRVEAAITEDHVAVKQDGKKICDELYGSAAFRKGCTDLMKSNLFYRGNPQFENWQLSDAVLDYIIPKCGFCPALDLCCDELGINARAPLYYCARSNALKQLHYIAGKEVICNPPFQLILAFGKLLNDAHAADAGTKAIFVIPYRSRCLRFYDHLLSLPHWKLVCNFATGSPVFVGVNKTENVFAQNLRQPVPSREPILVFSMQTEKENAPDARISIDELQVANRDPLLLISSLKAQIKELRTSPQSGVDAVGGARAINYKASGLPGAAERKAPDLFCSKCFRLFAEDKTTSAEEKRGRH